VEIETLKGHGLQDVGADGPVPSGMRRMQCGNPVPLCSIMVAGVERRPSSETSQLGGNCVQAAPGALGVGTLGEQAGHDTELPVHHAAYTLATEMGFHEPQPGYVVLDPVDDGDVHRPAGNRGYESGGFEPQPFDGEGDNPLTGEGEEAAAVVQRVPDDIEE